jgi:putative RNA 2'-phosphotransferase
MEPTLRRVSKFLSLILRHQPQLVGVTLDSAGYIEVQRLLAACAAHGHPISEETLRQVVEQNDKRRFALSADGLRIRASQGHSIAVDLAYAPEPPPDILYHGTVAAALTAIRIEGLSKQRRHHVHLSASRQEAQRVGARRGRPVVLTVRAGAMAQAGLAFYRSENGVWLTDHVPPAYLIIP